MAFVAELMWFWMPCATGLFRISFATWFLWLSVVVGAGVAGRRGAGRRRGGGARGGGRRRRGAGWRRVLGHELVGAGGRVAREQRIVGRHGLAVLVAVPVARRAHCQAAAQALTRGAWCDGHTCFPPSWHHFYQAGAWPPQALSRHKTYKHADSAPDMPH